MLCVNTESLLDICIYPFVFFISLISLQQARRTGEDDGREFGWRW